MNSLNYLMFQIVSIHHRNGGEPIKDCWVQLPQKKESVVWTIDPPLIYSLKKSLECYGYTVTHKELSFYIGMKSSLSAGTRTTHSIVQTRIW